ncbi:MAG TPA: hypothetical protein VGC66_16435 [Pyrinomonadaceae bacterium]|jgi:hypothetical protein
MNRVEFGKALCLLAAVALLIVASAHYFSTAQASGQQDMSGMDMGKPKPKPKPKPRPKPTPQKKKQAEPEKKEMEAMPGMDMGKPAPATTPKPAATPEPMQMNMPGMKMEPEPKPSPAATPAKTDEQMKMAMPSGSPQPSATPAGADMKMNMPATAAPSPDASRPQLNQKQDSSGNEGRDMGNMNMSGDQKQQGDGMKDSMPGMNMKGMSGTGRVDANSLMVMSNEGMDIRVGRSGSNAFSMGQMGSGTSWQPATTPMYMWYKSAGKWLIFFHGDMKFGVNAQGGPRGVTKFESQNWFMPMAFRRVGPGTLQLRGMFSAEPFTFSGQGSPQLFQTGETYKGQPIRDAQHPHDLFMELSATYTIPLGERGTWFTYLGFPGEPALGPTAFMHRWSASENPSAPLTHHLQDSTHISFGVFTTGFTYRWLKFEGSIFNGREPGENRYNFEFNPWNSRSFRVSFAPNSNWAMQWSYGLLKNPEALEPGDVRRMTASISYNKRFTRGNWASSLIWGRNREEHHNDLFTLNGYTAESTVQFLDKNYLYTRLELVDKTGLLNRAERTSLGITSSHPIFRIGAYTFGYSRDVWTTDRFNVALGSDVTLYSKPAVLDSVYGDNPVSYRFFIRVRPSRMSMK